ncbi:hypothetical protein NLG97_g3595 [Lecanicillium saksenae]|uniref:Uncharacterized protein n=1 Tax=Lecanicillium saksenae TaxID=468837 RepID=A0ACC1QZD7_9HYPO|nr:hypothetical protein NLG97_g3595 [Lecanicillium saksenae]
MKLQSFTRIASAAVAVVSTVDPAKIGLAAIDETSLLQLRLDACNCRCHNGKGHCKDQDECKTNAQFNPAQSCGCISGAACNQCSGCEEGCDYLDTDAATAACYLSCSRDLVVRNALDIDYLVSPREYEID